jgi:hypothetical protein
MDGNYQNKKPQIDKYLKDWIEKVIDGELWNKFSDLHVDEIINDFQDKKAWLNGSLYVFNCISNLVDKSNYDILLAIPLSCTFSKTQSHFSTFNELGKELDYTPPSFYLFPKDYKNFKDTIKSSQLLENLSNELNIQVFYKEEQEGEEFYRTIFLIY